MSEITLSLEHPSLGCGEIIARYDLSEIQEKAYQKGRADYQAECEKLFEDNPPMHFTTEQIMWIKERIKLQYQQGKVDSEIIRKVFSKMEQPNNCLFNNMSACCYPISDCMNCPITIEEMKG